MMDHQQRSGSYLDLKFPQRSCTLSTAASLLSLPPNVRQQIYEQVDVLRDGDIDLAPLVYGLSPRDPKDSLHNTLSLLQTSRTIYTEVSSLLYSTNHFYIYYRNFNSLKELRKLSPNALASLRHLTIHLNVACEIKHPYCNSRVGRVRYCHKHDEPLDPSNERGKTILDDWTLTAAYVFAYIQPLTFNFRLTCDVFTVEAAQLVLTPLSAVPPLASCAIRLAQKPDPILQALVQNAVTAITSIDSQDKSALPFPFLSLPWELRKQVLTSTDLVSPLREIQYSIAKNYHLHFSTAGCHSETGPATRHQACLCRNGQGILRYFCSNVHTAFGTGCRYWRPPTAIFLVSKEIGDLAREVFFEQNRFVLVPEGGVEEVIDCLPEQIHAEKFLRELVPKDARRHLRILELVFPPFQTPSESYFKEWRNTLKAVREDLNLPKLTIKVCFAEKRPDDNTVYRPTMTKQGLLKISETYLRVLIPLQQLKGLGRIFVKLPWAWEWTEVARRRGRREGGQRKRLQLESAEDWLERMVMGFDNEYDSGKLGKGEMVESQWNMENRARKSSFFDPVPT